MRVLAVLATAACVAASPCMAQVVIDGNTAAANHQYRAEQQREQAHYSNHVARERAAMGDYDGAAAAHAEARWHRHAAHAQEHQAFRDSQPGVHVEIQR